MIPDYLIQEKADAYHLRSRNGEFLSSHLLKDFRKCPLLYQQKITGIIKDEDKPAYAFGRAAHTLILEGQDVFDAEYTTEQPINPKTDKPYGTETQAYQLWLECQTKTPIKPGDYDEIMILNNAVKSHPAAAKLLEGIIAESVIRTEYCGVQCQIRMDAFHPERGFIDLKTCDDVDWFPFDAKKYGYWEQCAFYWEILMKASKIRFPVHIIAVEKKAPYRVRVDRLVEDDLMLSATENKAAIARLRECRGTGVWPTGYENIGYLTKTN
ncbi:MAG: PD-(D/E)XK nuclease-like domain-containing protein [Lentisphaerota bacterium]